MMHTFKRALAFLLVVALLACVPVATSAETDATVIDETVLHSITVEQDTGKGLAFRIKMNMKGAGVNNFNEFINTDATVTLNNEVYSVVKMGAVMTNQPVHIAALDDLTLSDVNAERKTIDVPARYLCAYPEATYCEFAVRITTLPEGVLGHAIGCRPYIVIEKDGVQTTIYGKGDISTYNEVYYTHNEAETPVLDVTGMGNVDEKIVATAGSAAYVPYETENYIEAFEVNLTLQNVTANAKTSVGDYVEYTCKDADGNVLGAKLVWIDELKHGESKDVKFYAPVGTATIEAGVKELNYVPDIIMPEIGSDIDVTKKKNRIRVSAAEASFNEDGTIHVKWTFKNYTSNWITEETDYIKYGYYKDGTRKGLATLYIGVIDTKKNPVKTFEFDVPAYTTEVRITSSKIVYWTEWA